MPVSTRLECTSCFEVSEETELMETRDGLLCEGCYESGDYVECRNCGESIHAFSDDWRLGRAGNCRDCALPWVPFPKHRIWKGDDAFISKNKGKIMQSVRAFGLECEVGYNDDNQSVHDVLSEINPNIGLTQDSGAEFQTPPASGEAAERIVEELSAAFQKHKYTARNGQGLHVHIDCRELKGMSKAERFDRIQGLWLFYILFDDVIRTFIGSYRRNNGMCGKTDGRKLISVRKAADQEELEALWYSADAVANKDYIESCKGSHKHGSRYKGFNLHALFNDYHLEIRYHESVIGSREMLEWANLHCLIMDKALAGIDRKWLEQIEKKSSKRIAMMKFLGLSDESKRYFRKKAITSK